MSYFTRLFRGCFEHLKRFYLWRKKHIVNIIVICWENSIYTVFQKYNDTL